VFGEGALARPSRASPNTSGGGRYSSVDDVDPEEALRRDDRRASSDVDLEIPNGISDLHTGHEARARAAPSRRGDEGARCVDATDGRVAARVELEDGRQSDVVTHARRELRHRHRDLDGLVRRTSGDAGLSHGGATQRLRRRRCAAEADAPAIGEVRRVGVERRGRIGYVTEGDNADERRDDDADDTKNAHKAPPVVGDPEWVEFIEKVRFFLRYSPWGATRYIIALMLIFVNELTEVCGFRPTLTHAGDIINNKQIDSSDRSCDYVSKIKGLGSEKSN
jgi:hypothetical protein